MSYFDHAFKKTFVGTNSFIQDGTTATSALTVGQFGFYDKSWANKATAPTTGEPLYLVAGSIHPATNDKIGPFAGGYSESVKSKLINPKYISGFWGVPSCPPQKAVITVGETFNDLDCNLNSGSVKHKIFSCNSTYNLRLDIKGSPVLRFLTRNNYFTAAAYTGCCAEGVDGIGAPVNPLVVYGQWAYQLLNSPLIAPFINIQITYSINGGTSWEQLAPGTNIEADDTTNLTDLFDYINGTTAYPVNATAPEDTMVGLVITGAYVDTQFGNCTFYPSDSIIAKLEPVKLYASEVDLNGDPCAFGGVCVANACSGFQGTGFGETAIRSVIMTEAYMQQPFYTGMDLRIREITNGDDVTNAIDRSGTYYRYFIQHNVPRFNNPTSTFDNDQYLLEIITDGSDTNFSDFINDWMEAAGNPTTFDTKSCPGICTPIDIVVAP